MSVSLLWRSGQERDMRSIWWWKVVRTSSVVVAASLFAAACGSGATEGPDDEAGQATTSESDSADGSGRDAGDADTGDDGGDAKSGGADIGGADDGTTDGGPGENGTTDNGTTANGTTGNGTTDNGTTDNGGGGEDEEEGYSWGLPGGDPSVDTVSFALYKALQNGCAEGQNELDRIWQDTLSPQNVLLFQAGIHVCAGDLERGRQVLAAAEARYGRAGLGGNGLPDNALCRVYKAVGSVLDQVAPETVECPIGSPPGWRLDCEFGLADPRISDEECAAQPTDTPNQ